MDRDINNDEINIIDFLEILWKGKLLIIFCAFIGALIGFGYLNFHQPNFRITVPYSLGINYNPYEKFIITEKKSVNETFLQFVEGDWELEKRKDGKNQYLLTKKTFSPLKLENYLDEFEKYNASFTNKIVEDANLVLQIASQFSPTSQGYEVVLEKIFEAEHTLASIESGRLGIIIGGIYIKEVSISGKIILLISSILGLSLGAGYVFIQNLIKVREKESGA